MSPAPWSYAAEADVELAVKMSTPLVEEVVGSGITLLVLESIVKLYCIDGLL